MLTAHALEILLVREAHTAIIGARCHHLGTCLNHRIRGTVVRAPFGDEWVVAKRHDRGGIGIAICWQFLYTHLTLCQLCLATKRHQDSTTTYRSIEVLNQSFLRSDISIGHDLRHFLLYRYTLDSLRKRIFLFYW